MSVFDDGFEGLPHGDWAIIHDLARRAYGIQQPWPVELAGHHLRWLQGERRVGNIKRPKDFPTTAVLAAEWNWPKWKVAEFVADTSRWEDPRRPVDLVDLRGDRLLGANKIPTAGRRQVDGGPTVDTDERRESTPNPDGKPTASRRSADVARGDSARVHRSRDPDQTGEKNSPPVRGSGSAAPAEGSPTAPAPTPSAAAHPQPAARPPKPRKPEVPGYREAIAAFHDAHLAELGTRYPWQFEGRDNDGALVKTWLSVAQVDPEDPGPGLDRIRAAIRVYFAAEKAGRVFPFGVLPTPARFTKGLAEWLRRDPDRPADPPPIPARSPPGRRRETLAESVRDWADLASEPLPLHPDPYGAT